MQPIAFCNRCRSMKVGWNRRYILHSLICKPLPSGFPKLLIPIVLLSVFIFGFPTSSGLVFSELNSDGAVSEATVAANIIPVPVPVPDPVVTSIKRFLERYGVDEDQRDRVAEAIAGSSRKHAIDPLLVASIMIVESRANPFAISESDSIGIMQIHLPTWGGTADKEGINLFKVEDNVDFGVRILKDYIKRYGLWDGVKRYKGWSSEHPESAQSALQYVQKIQRIYGLDTLQ